MQSKWERFIQDGWVNRGNLQALKACMQRAEAGCPLTVAFLGGSITQGSLATSDKTRYSWLVYEWWVSRFPQAKLTYVNGGIGGTTSHYGVARADKDVLEARPDVVFVDFSVNDEADAFFTETFEGLIRRLLTSSSHPAVVIMNNVFYDTGKNAEEEHNRVGRRYGLPCVSMKSGVYPLLTEGICRAEEITPDNLHPNDPGHLLLAKTLTAFLEQVYAEREQPEAPADFPAPLTANAYQDTVLYRNPDIRAELSGFSADTRGQTGMLDLYKKGWTAGKAGDTISFTLECSCLAVQYRKSVVQPVPRAVAILDGDEAHAVELDGNFKETWGDCLFLQPVLHHGQYMRHRLDIRITWAPEHAARPFYLTAILAS